MATSYKLLVRLGSSDWIYSSVRATANEITRAINIVRVCSPTTGAPAGASPRGVEAVREGASSCREPLLTCGLLTHPPF